MQRKHLIEVCTDAENVPSIIMIFAEKSIRNCSSVANNIIRFFRTTVSLNKNCAPLIVVE